MTLSEEPVLREDVAAATRDARGACRRSTSGPSVNLDVELPRRSRSNEADYTYTLPRGRRRESSARSSACKGRFRVRPTNCISYIAMNSAARCKPRSSGTTPSCGGPSTTRSTARRWSSSRASTRLVPTRPVPAGRVPRLPGHRRVSVPAGRRQGRELAAGHVPSGGPWTYYYGSTRRRARSAWSSCARSLRADRDPDRTAGLPRLRDLRRCRQARTRRTRS